MAIVKKEVLEGDLDSDQLSAGVDSGEPGILARARRIKRVVPSHLRDAFATVIDEMSTPVTAIIDGKRKILFGVNSYLGLNFHPACQKAASDVIPDFGTGSTASRVAGGTSRLHVSLEQEIAQFYGRRQGIIYSTGFMANLGVISALVRPGDAIFLDAHCHASIIDAARLSGAAFHFFKHNDEIDLLSLFRRIPIAGPRVLVVTEGLFSVSGDIAALDKILPVAKEHGAVTLVDEAHSLGIYGENGRGVAEHCGVSDLADVIVGTFSKSAGVIGGFSVTDRDEFRDIWLLARAYLYTASLPSSVVAAARQSLLVMRRESVWRDRLWENVELLRKGMARAGVEISGCGPIGRISIPMHAVGQIWRALLDRGIYVNLLIPPATPDGKAALRVSVSAAHSASDIDELIEAMKDVLGLVRAY